MAKLSSIKEVLFSSLKMASGTFTSRILGLVREQATAAMFGASGLTDAFLVAQRIPNMLRDLFAEGAFSSAFVPIFTETLQKDRLEARRLLWSLFILLGLCTSIISLLIIIFAPGLIEIFAPRFKADPEQFEVAVIMTRIMSPFLVLISLAALFMGVLNSLKIFFVPSLAPAFYNVVMILSILFLSPKLITVGVNPIFALGIGVVCGGTIQLLIQLPSILKQSFGPMGPIRLISSHTKKIISRVSIGTIGIAATQINILITTIMATGTVVGAVTWLSYAFRLFQFPVGILGVSIANSNLVHFSSAWKSGDRERAIDILQASYRLALVTIMVALALLLALSDQCVNLVFERGEFGFKDTAMTSMALRFYLIGLPFYGLYKIFSPTFYSLDEPKIPVIISVCAITCNIIFCLIMTPIYGFKILALGTSLSMLLIVFIQAIFLCRLLNLKITFFLEWRLLKVLIAGAACYWVTQEMASKYYTFSQLLIMKLLSFCLIAGVGVISYLGLLILMGELGIIKRLISKKSL